MIICMNCNSEVQDDEEFYRVDDLSASAVETLTDHGCELMADSIVCKECLKFISKECSDNGQTEKTVTDKTDIELLTEVRDNLMATEIGPQKLIEADNEDDTYETHRKKRKFEGDLSPERETSDLEPDLWNESVTYIKPVSQMPIWSSEPYMSCAKITIAESKFDFKNVHIKESVSEPFMLDKCFIVKYLEKRENSSSKKSVDTPTKAAVNETGRKKRKRSGQPRNGGSRIGNTGLRMPSYKRPLVPVLKNNLNMQLHTTPKSSPDIQIIHENNDEKNNSTDQKVDQLFTAKTENSCSISNPTEAYSKKSPCLNSKQPFNESEQMQSQQSLSCTEHESANIQIQLDSMTTEYVQKTEPSGLKSKDFELQKIVSKTPIQKPSSAISNETAQNTYISILKPEANSENPEPNLKVNEMASKTVASQWMSEGDSLNKVQEVVIEIPVVNSFAAVANESEHKVNKDLENQPQDAVAQMSIPIAQISSTTSAAVNQTGRKKRKRSGRPRNGGSRIGNTGLRMPSYKRPLVPVLKNNVYLNMHLHATSKSSLDSPLIHENNDGKNNSTDQRVGQLFTAQTENSFSISKPTEAYSKKSPCLNSEQTFNESEQMQSQQSSSCTGHESANIQIQLDSMTNEFAQKTESSGLKSKDFDLQNIVSKTPIQQPSSAISNETAQNTYVPRLKPKANSENPEPNAKLNEMASKTVASRMSEGDSLNKLQEVVKISVVNSFAAIANESEDKMKKHLGNQPQDAFTQMSIPIAQISSTTFNESAPAHIPMKQFYGELGIERTESTKETDSYGQDSGHQVQGIVVEQEHILKKKKRRGCPRNGGKRIGNIRMPKYKRPLKNIETKNNLKASQPAETVSTSEASSCLESVEAPPTYVDNIMSKTQRTSVIHY